jgi:hypothetical protein
MVNEITPPMGMNPPIFSAKFHVIIVNNMLSLQSTFVLDVATLLEH